MSKSNHTYLTTLLALGFGCTLTLVLQPQSAEGYPTTAVSMGTNPLLAAGGTVEDYSTSTLWTAPADQRIVLTDVVLSLTGASGYYVCEAQVSIDSGGGQLAEFRLTSDTNPSYSLLQPTVITHSYSSGLPVAPGEVVGITKHTEGCHVSYSLSGYYAEP